ncbi:MAG: dTDP-4-dehydrorhamnose reductase [Bacteroidales bacterium]|nr:dTDP-4-dehydrorhamnose reductase [Candidatus Equibacterium intestinale]
MNILVTGALGQLGREMQILAAGSSHRFFFTDISDQEGVEVLDITDPAAVWQMADRVEADCIVNCAAYTNVEKAESDQELCLRLNCNAVHNLAAAAKHRGALLVHISTDYVFGADEGRTPYREEQPGAPLGVYGHTKLLGEEAIAETGCRSVIIRTAWLYSEFGSNFLKTMLRLTAEKPVVKVVDDQVGTPTYALDLASAVMAVLEDYAGCGLQSDSYPHAGIYHYTDEGQCSWFEFAREIASLAGHDSCSVEPCTSEEYPSKVRRPAYSVLDKTKIKETFGIEIPCWNGSLSLCVKKLLF